MVWAVNHFHPYLYGHCHVMTDHEAIKSLLNTAHPSSELARWELAIHELDLHVEKVNQTADVPSHLPILTLPSDGKMLALKDEINLPVVQAKDGEVTVKQVEGNSFDLVAEQQDSDPELRAVKLYLSQGNLPEDQKAKEFVLNWS